MKPKRSEVIDVLETLMQRIAGYPDAALRELMQAMDKIERKHDLLYRLSDDERAAVQEGPAQAKRGEFATDEEVEAIFARHRRRKIRK
ncbi:MAG: hypothetical protein HY659_02200 [Rhizobiales bacterium]|nr:hypothetical protein [Hyphomicrobiales bacterium]